MSGRVLALTFLLLVASPVRSETPLETAQTQFAKGNYHAAVQTLQGVLRTSPQDAAAQLWLARCYFELRDWDKAVSTAERAVKLDSKNSEFHYWLGRSYAGRAEARRSLSDGKSAKSEYGQAVKLNPKNIPARRALMEYLTEANFFAGGSKSDAQDQIDAIASIDPLEGHLARGYFWRLQEKWDLADAEYRHVFESKPRNVEPYVEAADFFRKRRDVTGLKAATDAVAQLDPKDPRLAYYRGLMHVVSGEGLAEGERLLQSYLKDTSERSDYPPHASAHEWLGKLYQKMGRCREAEGNFRLALQMDPELRDARDALKHMKCS